MNERNPIEQFTSRQKFIGGLRVIFSGLIWGLIPIFLRLTDGNTMVKVWMRVVVSFIAMVVYMFARGRFHLIYKVKRSVFIDVGIQGALLAANWVFFLFALDGAGSVALGELLGYTSPIFIALLAPIVLKEKLDTRVFISIMLALIGLTFILAPHGFSLQGETLWRAAMGLVSAFTVTILTLRGKRAIRGVPSDLFMVIENGVASILIAPIAIYFIATGDGPTTVASWLTLILGLGGVCTALASFIYMEGFRRIRADHVAVLSYTEPISAILYTALLPWAATFLPFLGAAIPDNGEPITLPVVIGAALVVAAGVYIMRLERGEGEGDDPAKEIPSMEFPE